MERVEYVCPTQKWKMSKAMLVYRRVYRCFLVWFGAFFRRLPTFSNDTLAVKVLVDVGCFQKGAYRES